MPPLPRGEGWGEGACVLARPAEVTLTSALPPKRGGEAPVSPHAQCPESRGTPPQTSDCQSPCLPLWQSERHHLLRLTAYPATTSGFSTAPFAPFRLPTRLPPSSLVPADTLESANPRAHTLADSSFHNPFSHSHLARFASGLTPPIACPPAPRPLTSSLGVLRVLAIGLLRARESRGCPCHTGWAVYSAPRTHQRRSLSTRPAIQADGVKPQ